MNFTLKLQESFIYTLIQVTVKDDNYLITLDIDPPYVHVTNGHLVLGRLLVVY